MKDDFENCIFQSSSTEINNTTTDSFYTTADHSAFTDGEGYCRTESENNQAVYAKKIKRDDGTIKYLVKTDTRGKLFNPLSIYGQEKTTNFLDKTCRDTKFKSVNFRTFEMYIKFLTTKNLSWLHNAEREAE